MIKCYVKQKVCIFAHQEDVGTTRPFQSDYGLVNVVSSGFFFILSPFPGLLVQINLLSARLPKQHSPPILLQLHTRISIHAQTALQQQSNGNFEARMSEKCRETSLSRLYPQSIGSQCKIKDQRYHVWGHKNHSK